ncbi:sirohydrochlorin ferrochelatase [Candidatus Tenderia electrophaga]|jgi:uroporphyrin-III C-methyltransferase/precorrin-2 dehydrogenase/sirohydrochlorin ferrochelatase|uniref:Siroheme synthase n=1 Tax=Candidatus Tenderia electrophaga TaxID=1748243 RepID=A0A0S2TEA7_9GAMM|nr:sirohydrochlorin ferrochelatase [Candidatus Tenderia electrophaga]
MDFLPIFIDLKGRPVLVVGGGEVAARKVGLLLRAQAQVRVVAPELCDALRQMEQQGRIDHIAAAYQAAELEGAILAIAATSDEAVNRRVSLDARQRGMPVNVADAPELCTFILPSIIDRSPLMVAVSTGGASPTLGRLLRARLETLIPASYGRFAELLGRFREPVKQRFKTLAQRRRFWEQVVQGPIAELVYANKDTQAEQALQAAIDQADSAQLAKGEVYLVGAGPGDPDLLTFRALRLMQQADVVLYDRLVAPEILSLVRREAEQIYVGKKRAYHALRQEEINGMLIKLAKQGKRVLRLKGGDPFIFGRGGEEISGLAQQGIPFQVVPGITAAAGCASYAGIPLTHRDYAQSVIFVTGQLQDGTVDLEWQTLVQPRQTVVVYMGLAGLQIICDRLIAHGMAATMPAALIQQGTTPAQRVITGTLADLPQVVAQHEVHAPTLLIIGEVVRLHDQLNWFDPVS